MGAVRYIEKPSQLEEFLSTVGRAVKEIFKCLLCEPVPFKPFAPCGL
jgi:hypothetical protein